MKPISIVNASEKNLKHISLDIPRNSLTVFTGLSGSGKSTLLIDVLYMECQRQYLEAMSFQGIAKPAVERVKNASPAVVITQTDQNRSPRSTVGTMTDLYTGLRMLYEKLGVRACPHCGKAISAADCREEVVSAFLPGHAGKEFTVYQYCRECGQKMKKLTATDFSFNTKEGACPVCRGMGEVRSLNRAAAVDEARSLEEGAVRFWEAKYGEYQTEAFYAACRYYGLSVPSGLPVSQFDPLQKALLYDGISSPELIQAFPGKKPPKTVAAGRFEGLEAVLLRRLNNRSKKKDELEAYFHPSPCPACGGERLKRESREVTINGARLPQLNGLSLDELAERISGLEASLPASHRKLVQDYLTDLSAKLERIRRLGLGYLTCSRAVPSLSGGELQRLKLSAVLASELTGMIYILDEPTAGLHPEDTEGLISLLRRLRDLGNTVLVIEHDPDVMRAADHIVDMGPGSGRFGGEVVAAGTLNELLSHPVSITGRYLRTSHPIKTAFRSGDGGRIQIREACLHNLKNLNAAFPTGCLNVVTGPSGSGKSTLVFSVLAEDSHRSGEKNIVKGLEAFSRIISVRQASAHRMKRSNVATYTDLYAPIRKLFAEYGEVSSENGARGSASSRINLPRIDAAAFSFNRPGGRCETCEGMGTVRNHLVFFADSEVTCPVCQGRRFQDHVLAVRFLGLSISDVLDLSVAEALSVFEASAPEVSAPEASVPDASAPHSKASLIHSVIRILHLLEDVGLDYLTLGQSLTTLSEGECQRLKLARELLKAPSGHSLYLLDEPTRGLHPLDVEHFLNLLNRLVDAGNTVIVVEHNQLLILAADYVLDLGPGGGEQGGRVVFSGTPQELLERGTGVTADCLRKAAETDAAFLSSPSLRS
ncbi:MAG TPA: excinuclease ABC subunit UvrA [Candidatus Eisenbergiella merdipullorum]|uniref:UvrABC system protein A n=1 Tax=Candidatus Eisenbergiella merdipullorum TaxID=2838553 RepID=A0A9D2I5J9_9FIRM|nr:excinuclease ABC subunit UvrA [Candidatus Eisenbergiella merdipullorum]